MAITGFGTEGTPVFYRVSTDKDPTHKYISVQSDYPLVYVYSNNAQGYLGVSQAPSGTSPLVATWTFSSLTYPNTVNVEVHDAASYEILGNCTIQLFGADVFKVRITYASNNPASHGYIDALIDGNRMTIYGQDYIAQDFSHDDVTTRGSGN